MACPSTGRTASSDSLAPFTLPGSVPLYSSSYVSGVSASTLTRDRRRTLLDHSLRSESNAASLVRSLELGQIE